MGNAVITDATAGLGSSGIGSLMTVLADEYLSVKRYRSRIIKFCNTDGQQMPGAWDTVRFMVPPSGTTINTETDGTAPALDDSTTANGGGYVDVQAHTHVSAFFGVSQVGQTLDGGRSLAPLMAGRTADLFNNIEADIAALGSTFAQSYGIGATALTETTYDNARSFLVTKQIPEGDPLHAVYAPGTNNWVAISNIASFREYRLSSLPSPERNGEFGVTPVWWKNAYHIESQAIKSSAYSGSTEYFNLLFHRDALLVAFKPLQIPLAGSGVSAMNFQDPESGIGFQIMHYFDQTKHGDVFKLHALYGRSIGRTDWGVVLLG